MNLIVYRKHLLGFLQFFMDALALSASFLLAYYFKKTILFADPELSSASYLKLYSVALPFLMATLYFSGLYSLRVMLLPLRSWFTSAVRSVAYMFIMLIVLTFYLKLFSYSRMVFTLFLFIFIPLLVLSKAVFNSTFLKPIVSHSGIASEMVVFTDRSSPGMLDTISVLHGCSVNVIYMDEESSLDAHDMAQIDQGKAAGVFIDLAHRRFKDILDIFKKANREGVPVYMSPRSIDNCHTNVAVEMLGDQPVIAFYPNHIPGFGWVLKRGFDLVLSLLGVLVLSPLMLVIACLVKVTSPGPVIFRQTRVGLGGRLFTIYKFRTMKVNAEADTGPIWASEGDGRVTGIGRFLRKTNLDELPQLFNVITGDMSLVGPRPERPEFVTDFKEQIGQYSHKHCVRPGITGWAQINGWRGDTSLPERIKCDLFYIENWSLWIDFKILIYTPFKAYKNAM